MKKTLFLVMDMMNDLVAEDGSNAQTYGVQVKERNVLANTAKAIAAARAAGAKVGYVRVGFSPDYREAPAASPIFSGARKNGIFQLGTKGTEVHPALAPAEGDFDIVKHRVSPFYGTRLEPLLRALGVARIYISGVSTSGVVLSGAKEGHDRDYEIFVIEDCCAALTDEQHNGCIEQMNRMTTILNSKDVTFQEGR